MYQKHSGLMSENADESQTKLENFHQLWSFVISICTILNEKHSGMVSDIVGESLRNFTIFGVFDTKLPVCTVYNSSDNEKRKIQYFDT